MKFHVIFQGDKYTCLSFIAYVLNLQCVSGSGARK